MTGSTTSCGSRPGRGQLGDRPDDLRGGQHAGLDRGHRQVVEHRLDLGQHELGRHGVHARGRRPVFCAVSAVMALVPKTPSAAKVLRSAWMPAPPPESEPAMVRATGGFMPATSSEVGGGRTVGVAHDRPITATPYAPAARHAGDRRRADAAERVRRQLRADQRGEAGRARAAGRSRAWTRSATPARR